MNQLQILTIAVTILAIAFSALIVELFKLNKEIKIRDKAIDLMKEYFEEQQLKTERIISTSEQLHAQCKIILSKFTTQNKP